MTETSSPVQVSPAGVAKIGKENEVSPIPAETDPLDHLCLESYPPICFPKVSNDPWQRWDTEWDARPLRRNDSWQEWDAVFDSTGNLRKQIPYKDYLSQ